MPQKRNPKRPAIYRAAKFLLFDYKEHGVPFTGETRRVVQVLWWKCEWFIGNPAVDLTRIRASSDPGDSAAHRLLD